MTSSNETVDQVSSHLTQKEEISRDRVELQPIKEHYQEISVL